MSYVFQSIQVQRVRDQQKMPKRNAAQKLKHNESRRLFMKEGKKAIFCINHLNQTHPRLVKEACRIYDYLYEKYPGKRDLARTDIYRKHIMSKKNQLEVVLNIPLSRSQTSGTQTSTTEIPAIPSVTSDNETTAQRPPEQMEASSTQTSTVEITPTLPVMTDNETAAIIQELQADPDLSQFFNDETLCQETVPEGVQLLSPQEEIERIIREEFEKLGNDLPDLTAKDEELMC